MRKFLKSAFQWSVAIILLVVTIWLSFKDINFNEFKDELLDLNYWILSLAVPIVLLSHYMRAVRWKLFLNPIKEVKSYWSLFSAVMIGYFVNTITSRGGEFLRPLVTSRKENISYSSTFATIVLERIIDAITLMLVFGITFLLSEDIVKIIPGDINPISITIISSLIIVVALLNLYPPFLDFMLRATIKPFSEKLFEKVHGLFERFKKGLSILKSPSKYISILAQSLFIWVLYATPIYIAFYAFDIKDSLSLDFIDALMIVVAAGVSVTIAPTPGGVGVFHFIVSTAVINLYGMENSKALAFATVTHAVSLLTQTFVGFLFFKKEGLESITPKRSKSEEIEMV